MTEGLFPAGIRETLLFLLTAGLVVPPQELMAIFTTPA